MSHLTRRQILASALATASPAAAQTRRYRLLLNTSFSGPVSFFLLARDRGYLREEGLDIALSPGGGAAVIVPQVTHGAYDIGYGDMSALIERIARQPPNEGPVAIYTTFNTVPFTIAVSAKGPIRTPKDLEGRTLIGHPFDAALITFDMFARAAGIDATKVRVLRSPTSMGGQVSDMLKRGEVHGVFGFVNTIIASAAPLGIDSSKELRFLDYADHLSDMYGNTLFVTRELYRDDKRALAGMVRAWNRALAETARNPDLAIDALAKQDPSIRRDVDRTRLVGTLKSEMAHPEGARIGVGDMDDQRLARLIALIVAARQLPRTPAVREVFDRSFLPPEKDRIKSLAKR